MDGRASAGGGRRPFPAPGRQLRRAANPGHTLWAHDPNSRHPDVSPPEPAASASANWTVPIFWPLSAQWARVQLPAWPPAQDGHGRQQALCQGGGDKCRGSVPLSCMDTTSQASPSPNVRDSHCCSSTFSPPPPSHLHRTLSFAPPRCPMTQGLFPPPKRPGTSRRLTHAL